MADRCNAEARLRAEVYGPLAARRPRLVLLLACAAQVVGVLDVDDWIRRTGQRAPTSAGCSSVPGTVPGPDDRGRPGSERARRPRVSCGCGCRQSGRGAGRPGARSAMRGARPELLPGGRAAAAGAGPSRGAMG